MRCVNYSPTFTFSESFRCLIYKTACRGWTGDREGEVCELLIEKHTHTHIPTVDISLSLINVMFVSRRLFVFLPSVKRDDLAGFGVCPSPERIWERLSIHSVLQCWRKANRTALRIPSVDANNGRVTMIYERRRAFSDAPTAESPDKTKQHALIQFFTSLVAILLSKSCCKQTAIVCLDDETIMRKHIRNLSVWRCARKRKHYRYVAG